MTPLLLVALLMPLIPSGNSDAGRPELETMSGYRQKREENDAVGELTKLQESLKKEYGDKDRRVKGLVKALENTKTDLSAKTSAKSSINAASVKTAVTGVVAVLPKFKSSDPLVVASALTDALSSVTSLIPGPHGAAISTIFSVVGGLIGLANKTPTMAQVVEGIIKKQLKIERQNELADEVSGAKRELDSLHCVLAAASGDKPKETDILFINSQAGNQIGLRIMGILENYIRRESRKINSVSDFEAHMKLTKLYVELTNIRTQLLYMMHSLYYQSNLTKTTEKGILAAINSTLKIDGNLFRFYSSPAPVQAYLVASLLPAEYPSVANYFKKLGIDLNKTQDELVANKCGYYMYSAKKEWKQYYIADDADESFRIKHGLSTYIQVYGKTRNYPPEDHNGRATIIFQRRNDSVTMVTKAAKAGHLSTLNGYLVYSVEKKPTTYRLVKTNSRGMYYWMNSGPGGGNTVRMKKDVWTVRNSEVGPVKKRKALWKLESAC